jgi:hypothetical protein
MNIYINTARKSQNRPIEKQKNLSHTLSLATNTKFMRQKRPSKKQVIHSARYVSPLILGVKRLFTTNVKGTSKGTI